jgi:hypothetical protein
MGRNITTALPFRGRGRACPVLDTGAGVGSGGKTLGGKSGERDILLPRMLLAWNSKGIRRIDPNGFNPPGYPTP